MRRKFLTFLILTVATTAALCGCSFIKKPKVSVESIIPSGVGLSSVTLNVKIRIDNPNPFGAHLTKLEFDVYYLKNGKFVYLGHGEKQDISIKANGVTKVTVPVKTDDLQAIGTLLQLAKSGTVTIKVKGCAYIDLKITSFGVPFEQIEVIKI